MKETSIMKQIELKACELGCIVLRLNSGKFYQGVLKTIPKYNLILTQLRHINGCPSGTADLLIIAPNAKVIFCETKTDKGKQRMEQIRFQLEIEKLGHKYLLARSVDDLAGAL